jgi:hypothetical protein
MFHYSTTRTALYAFLAAGEVFIGSAPLAAKELQHAPVVLARVLKL